MDKQMAIGRNLIVATEQKAPDSFVTTVTDTRRDELIDSKAATNEQDALQDFDDMLTTYALPLQARFHGARMKKGGHYTLVMLNDFGFPVALRFTFDHFTMNAYAQYDDAVCLFFTPFGKRKIRFLSLYARSFMLYDGWREFPDNAVWNITRSENGIVARMSKYGCFDERYMDDIKTLWPDFISAYDYANVHRPAGKAEPETAEPLPDESFEITPGLTYARESGFAFVDMSPDDFAALYGSADESLPTEERLTRALRRATVASMAHIDDEDGGTCNFDSPVLDYESSGITKETAKEAVKAAGLSCYDWEKMLVITGCFSGQGNRRTKMAEAFSKSLESSGLAASMYYQMD